MQGAFFDFEILNFKFRVTAEFVTSYLDIVFFPLRYAVKRPSEPLMVLRRLPAAGAIFKKTYLPTFSNNAS